MPRNCCPCCFWCSPNTHLTADTTANNNPIKITKTNPIRVQANTQSKARSIPLQGDHETKPGTHMRTKEVQQQAGQERGQLNKSQVKQQVVLSESLWTKTLMQHAVAKRQSQIWQRWLLFKTKVCRWSEKLQRAVGVGQACPETCCPAGLCKSRTPTTPTSHIRPRSSSNTHTHTHRIWLIIMLLMHRVRN